MTDFFDPSSSLNMSNPANPLSPLNMLHPTNPMNPLNQPSPVFTSTHTHSCGECGERVWTFEEVQKSDWKFFFWLMLPIVLGLLFLFGLVVKTALR